MELAKREREMLVLLLALLLLLRRRRRLLHNHGGRTGGGPGGGPGRERVAVAAAVAGSRILGRDGLVEVLVVLVVVRFRVRLRRLLVAGRTDDPARYRLLARVVVVVVVLSSLPGASFIRPL